MRVPWGPTLVLLLASQNEGASANVAVQSWRPWQVPAARLRPASPSGEEVRH